MKIIPVIDLMDGKVVRARMGERHLYAPIETPLSPSSEAQDVIAGFLALHPFDAIYIADLDAIEGRAPHDDLIASLRQRFPQLSFWIDSGLRNRESVETALSQGADVVIASESFEDVPALDTYKTNPRVILSLDFRGDEFQGTNGLLDPTLWPDRIITMTLARVGSDAGPDFERLQDILDAAGPRKIYAAGGLRGRDDLARLRDMGVAGVLVASALHDGRLSPNDLLKFK